jgi:3-polyprenyl-4-hydroxybenzoate decarboxylase
VNIRNAGLYRVEVVNKQRNAISAYKEFDTYQCLQGIRNASGDSLDSF